MAAASLPTPAPQMLYNDFCSFVRFLTMLFLHRPGSAEIQKFIAGQSGAAFSYDAVGATSHDLPPGFIADHNRMLLGKGEEVFGAACRALTGWKMFDIGWIELLPPETPIKPGQTVAVLAKIYGLWFLSACRIVYTVDEDGPVRRFGFAYGTLPEHAESGEERFTVEWKREDNSVWYDILAFSRPNQLLSTLAYPFARRLQRQFARDSKRAMLEHSRPR